MIDTKEAENVALRYARQHLSQDVVVDHVQLAGVESDCIILNVRCVHGNQKMTILVRSGFTLHDAEVII